MTPPPADPTPPPGTPPATPAATPPALPPRPNRRYAVGAAALLAVAAACGWQLWGRAPAPTVPALDLAGADPKVAKAVESARRKVEEEPRSAAVWGRLGMVLRAHDYGAEANACFAQAEKLDPKDPRWPYQQGVVLLISDPDAGLAALRRAADLGGKIPSPTLLLAETLVSRGEFDEARPLFERVVKADGLNPRAHHGLGLIAHRRGDDDTALRHLDIAKREAPWAQATHALRAEIYHARGDRERAEEESAAANRLAATGGWPDPYTDEVARLRVGVEPRLAQAAELLQQNRAGEATDVLTKAAAEYPDSFDVCLSLGKAHLRASPPDYPAAEKAFRDAVRLRKDDPAAHFHLGIALEQQGQYRPAADAYAAAVVLKPDYAFAHFNRGQCLLRLDDKPTATEAFRAAARVRPNFPEAHRELGSLLLAADQPGEAVRHLEQATRLAPTDARAKQLLDDARKALPPKK